MQKQKNAVILLIFIFSLFFTMAAHAYLLPEYEITPDEQQTASEAVLEHYKQSMFEFTSSATLNKLKAYKQNSKMRLSKSEQALVPQYEKLNVALEFWQQVNGLKKDLLSLHAVPQNSTVATEADVIAKSAIETIYGLSQKWRIGGSALFHNFLINHGFREKGFCFHYVEELEKVLNKFPLHYFDLHEASAWEGTFRENNALVITAKDEGFESGIAIDAWRHGGRPFWTPVKGDRFPWKKASY